MPREIQERLAERSPDERRGLEQVWDRLGREQPRELRAPSVDEAWVELAGRTASAPVRRHVLDRPPVRRGGREARAGVVAIAAAVFITATVAVAVWLWYRPVVVAVPPGALATVRLPDGSAVELNSDSELRYRRRFQVWPFVAADVRSVALRGEGFFDVVRSERPFHVETSDARVEVLGTQFNVRARGTAADRATTVTLAAGRVRVTLRDETGTAAVLAEAGTSARVERAPGAARELVVREVPLAPVLAWRHRAFAAVDRPMAAILEEVERQFAVDIAVEGPLALSDSMTVFYSPPVTPEDILHDLCLVHGCRFRPTSRGFAVAPSDAAPGRDV